VAWFVLGVCLLVALLLGARWFVSADPKVLAKAVRWGAVGIAAAVVIFLALTGRIAAALPIAFVVLMLMRRRPRFRFPSMGGAPSLGQSSEVETEYLSMTLDHDSGMVSGRVLRGRFAGREFGDLGFEELMELLAECRQHDEQGARLVESYLDRVGPEDWRERTAGGAAGGGFGPMSSEEAYEILGLEPGATAEEIKDAHRRLMQKIHPDHGGSSYLAAKINRAKEILLEA
jgi:hypothetical protein